MEQFAVDFKQKYPEINVEEFIETFHHTDADGIVQEDVMISYTLNNIRGLNDLSLGLEKQIEFEKLDSIITNGTNLFKDYLGGKFKDEIQVLLTLLSKSTIPIKKLGKPIEVNINYKGAEIKVSIEFVQTVYTQMREIKSEIFFIARKLDGFRLQRSMASVKLIGLKGSDVAKLEVDTKNILRSVLFDIESTYGICFEITPLESLKLLKSKIKIKYNQLSPEEISLIYKDYIPELVEYFHIAEKVDYLPFKYICYFHILEYFMDKSAYSVVSRKLKQLISKPDFHIKSNEYISNAINFIKAETERNTTDKIKIGRVISEYTDMENIKQFLDLLQIPNHFDSDHILACNKPLKISQIKFDSESHYVETITKRIYAIRCSIVHSNPEFDENKAVPFMPTPQNMDS